jgi:hypothetical protein
MQKADRNGQGRRQAYNDAPLQDDFSGKVHPETSDDYLSTWRIQMQKSRVKNYQIHLNYSTEKQHLTPQRSMGQSDRAHKFDEVFLQRLTHSDISCVSAFR